MVYWLSQRMWIDVRRFRKQPQQTPFIFVSVNRTPLCQNPQTFPCVSKCSCVAKRRQWEATHQTLGTCWYHHRVALASEAEESEYPKWKKVAVTFLPHTQNTKKNVKCFFGVRRSHHDVNFVFRGGETRLEETKQEEELQHANQCESEWFIHSTIHVRQKTTAFNWFVKKKQYLHI